MDNQSDLFNVREAMALFEGQVERFQKFAPMMCEDMRAQLDTMAKAVAEGDAPTAERCAHTVKGHAGALAGHRVRQLAYEAERHAKEGRMHEVETLVPRFKREVEAFSKAIQSTAAEELNRYAAGSAKS